MGARAHVYHGRQSPCSSSSSFLSLPLLEETKKEEAATAKMAVVHTGRMPVLRVKKQLPNRNGSNNRRNKRGASPAAKR
jgi:hypothetical protein